VSQIHTREEREVYSSSNANRGELKMLRLILVIAVVLIGFGLLGKASDSEPTKTASKTDCSQFEKQTAHDLATIKQTSRTYGEAYSRSASSGFWNGFAKGMAGC
jgi:hypothetical protein